jgi:hypothetical protein
MTDARGAIGDAKATSSALLSPLRFRTNGAA